MSTSGGTSGGGSGTISDVTSADGTLAVTNPAGPTTDLAVTVPAPAAATTVTGPDAYGAAAVVGVGASFARDDHDHGLPALVGASSAAEEIPADVAVTAATLTAVLTTAVLAPGSYAVIFGLTVENAGAVAGTLAGYASEASGTFISIAPLSAQTELPAVTGGCTYLSIAVNAVCTVAGALQFNLYSSVSCTVKQLAPGQGYGGASGYIAMRYE